MSLHLFNIFKRSKQREAQGVSGAVYSSVRNVIGVNTDSAMRLSAVYACVRILSDTVAGLPLRYERRNYATDVFQPYQFGAGQKLYYALTVRPNERMTAYQLWKNVVSQILLRGNAYVVWRSDETGDISKLYLVTADCVVYDKYSNTYTICDAVNNISGQYSADRVLHFRNTSLDGGYTGVSTIEFARKQLQVDATAENVVLDRFGCGGIGKFVYRDKDSSVGFGQYADEELRANGADIEEQLVNRCVAVVKGDGELTQMQMTSADMQFIEQQKITVRAIGRYFGVHPSHLYEDTSNYKSVDTANITQYTNGVRPILQNIENELNAKLLTATNYMDYRFRFDIGSLYITDALTEADYLTKRISNGTLTINEARKRVDLAPVDGGDTTLISTNMAGLSSDKIQGEYGKQ